VGAASATVENNVRILLRDIELNNLAVGSFALKRALENAMHYVAQAAGMGETRTTGYVTLVASTHEYTLPPTGSVQFQWIQRFIRDFDNFPLDKVTEDDILQWRRGTGTPSRGHPRCAAWSYGTGSAWTLRVYPEPDGAAAAYKLSAIFTQVPTSLGDDGTVTIPFDEPLLRGLEQLVAARCALGMRKSEREERGISDAEVQGWQRGGGEVGFRSPNDAVSQAWGRIHQGKLRDRVLVRMG
jgi:hypothetical protein